MHKLIPFETKIKAGGTVNFIIGGFHLPGAPPGFPPVVDDPVNRIYRGLSPFGLPQDRVEAVNFAVPGRHLVVCTFLPHFNDRMFGYVRVLP